MVAEFYNQRWISSASVTPPVTTRARDARLVALGNLEAPDLDRELFSSTINNKTTNLMFVLAAQHGLKIRGLDVYGAFITAFIDSPVYFQLPKGLRPDIHYEPRSGSLRRLSLD